VDAFFLYRGAISRWTDGLLLVAKVRSLTLLLIMLSQFLAQVELELRF